MGSKGSLVCQAYPDKGTGTSEDVLNILAIRGPTHEEGMPRIEHESSDRQSSQHLYATAAGIHQVNNWIIS